MCFVSTMDFARQTWTLTVKNLLIVFVRHWFSTTFRALVLPIVFVGHTRCHVEAAVTSAKYH